MEGSGYYPDFIKINAFEKFLLDTSKVALYRY
jgi:hypothetical protein